MIIYIPRINPLGWFGQISSSYAAPTNTTGKRNKLLKSRPMRCYKCSALGHAAQRCPSRISRDGRCFNCGEIGHTIKICRNPAKCVVCEERKLDSNHKIGLDACRPYPPDRLVPSNFVSSDNSNLDNKVLISGDNHQKSADKGNARLTNHRF